MTTTNFLETMAYIMIIIVCFAILVTILVYFIFLLIKKRAGSSSTSSQIYCVKHAKEKEEICINPQCVICLKNQQTSVKKNDNISNLESTMMLNNNSYSNNEQSQTQQDFSCEKSPKNNFNYQNSTDGLIHQIINRLKTTFYIDSEVDPSNNKTTLNREDLRGAKNSCMTLTGSSIVTENESGVLESSRKKISKSNIRKSIRKNKNSVIRAPSLVSTSAHSVKFKDDANLTDEYSSDESFSSSKNNITSKTSDYSSMKSSINSSKKNSISSYINSRKSSSISSNYNEPAVVDYYRKKRLSDASSFNTSMSDISSRKYSINYPSSFKDSSLKFVALEQQPSIVGNSLGNSSKKSSISSVATTSSRVSSSFAPQKARRYSIMTPPNISEKFWVPPEIAKNAQLEKQRASLPNSDIILEFNEKLSELKSDANGLDDINEAQTIDTETDSMNQNSARRESSTSGGAVSMSPSTKACGNPGVGRRRASMFDPIDPTELQKTLYQNLKEKQEQNSSNQDEQIIDSIGTFEFGIQYLSDSQKLVVDLLRIFDLQFKDTNPNSDLYCKCALMPDKLSYQTKLIKRNSNPIFEEQFEFDYLDTAKLDTRYLEISIHELDKVTKEDCLGVVNIKLNYSNIESKKIFLKEIKPYTRSREENYIGDLMFSLAYLPAAERLTIVVIKARNLQGLGSDKKLPPDPFIKVSILSKDGKKIKKKKTSSQKGTTCPTYNEEIVFSNLKKEQLNEIVIQFLIYHDSITNRELLGSVSISSSSRGNEYVQWKDMLDGKKSIAWWHPLNILNTNVDSDFNPNQNVNAHTRRNSKAINLFNFKPKSTLILSNSSNVNKQALAENS
ncbi:unnamed protein product [Brachionus calyciflorus]|uniref:C2 domain-containing protein n=1 Tax=Brachionus calyciflorus TaxID=104777 RepID=A0A813ML82_9BILA|nr:unnamed protein product [Brachionus calyciflorus]